MKEHMLQLLWKSHIGNIPELTTFSGQKIYVLDTGSMNTGDGPDYLNAKIRTQDGLILCGAVEIHIDEQDWYNHGHHTDILYNSVILHVILKTGKNRVQTQNGYTPETISATPLLHFGHSGYEYHQKSLPCQGNVHYISNDVILAQFEKAKSIYFEELKERLLTHWNPSLPLSEAWFEALIISYADGLGISKNREPMQRLAKLMLAEQKLSNTPITEERALELTGLSNTSGTTIKREDWHLKGSRPNNRPQVRIPELLHFMQKLKSQTISDFRSHYYTLWSTLVQKKGYRSQILFHTVYLPAVYLLGELFFDENLKTQAYQQWNDHSVTLNSSIKEYFSKAGFSNTSIPSHLGVVYQMKNLCMKQNCGECSVFKKITAIGS
jgi:hypothetical protein